MAGIDAVATNEAGMLQAQNDLTEAFVERLRKNPNMFGTVTVEVHVNDGVITGHNLAIKNIKKNRAAK